MRFLSRRVAVLPCCVVLALGSVGYGATGNESVVEEAPTLRDVNAAVQSQDFAQAERLCREIVAQDSSNGQAYFLLGYALHAQGELDEAILYHLMATSFEQTAPLAYYNLGCAQALKGNADQAFKALGQAVELGVNNSQQYQGDSDLKSLHEDPRWGTLLSSNRSGLTAQSASSPTPDVVLSSVETKLHFWVGQWDCYAAQNGKLVGRNVLELRAGKRAIHESWVSDGDSYAGESWTHFDPRSGSWKQIWTGANGDLAEFESDPDSELDGVFFTGTAFAPSIGETEIRKMHVRKIGNGRLRHTGTASSDDGATWIVKYDLIYVPRGEAFELEDLSI